MKTHKFQIFLWRLFIPQKYKNYNQYLKDGMSFEFAFRRANKSLIEFHKYKNKYTLEEVESKVGFKLQYPFQTIEGNVDDEKYKELREFGCSDIMDNQGHWLHRDCFIGRNPGICEQCNFFPVKERYQLLENIKNNPEADDFVKAVTFNFGK